MRLVMPRAPWALSLRTATRGMSLQPGAPPGSSTPWTPDGYWRPGPGDEDSAPLQAGPVRRRPSYD